MGRYEIALEKPPPPPPEPSFYFIGVDKGEIRPSIQIVVGHLEKGEGPDGVLVSLFIVDSAESISPAVQELNKHSTTTLLDFVKFIHKPMKARINSHSKFIDEVFSLHGISCEQCPEFITPEWRSALYQKSLHFLCFKEKDRKYGLNTSEFQRAFELALSLALDSIPVEKKEIPDPFNGLSAKDWWEKQSSDNGPF
jgi:hypothetical protein